MSDDVKIEFGVKIELGQRWISRDKRDQGRTVEVVDFNRHPTFPRVVVRNVATGKETKVKPRTLRTEYRLESLLRRNHYDADGRLTVVERTMFKLEGYVIDGGYFATTESAARHLAKGRNYRPVYSQVAVDHGDGWQD